MAQDRTEQPTSRRLNEARKRGQIARSRDLSDAVHLGASLMVLTWTGSWIVAGLGRTIAEGLGRMASGAHHTLESTEIAGIAARGMWGITLFVGPVAAAGVFAVLALGFAQSRGNIATEALTLRWSALSPANGIKRLAFRYAGLDFVKMAVAVTALGWLSWRVVSDLIVVSPHFARLEPLNAAIVGWDSAARLLRQAAILLGTIAAADYGVQVWRTRSSLKMTKQEVKDDTKLTEGNPEIKGRVRRIQREIARRRMLAAVPRATVVITNPTEYAVALEYRRSEMVAPRVLAKGKGFLAARIKAVAREHDIPTVENVPLAQALYRGAEVGEFIPSELFGAVAEVLAYLVRLKRLVL